MTYTPEMISFLRKNASRHTKTFTDLFNKEFNTNITTMQIQHALIYYKISYEKNLKLTQEMIEFLILNALKYNPEILTDLFNKEFNTNTTSERLRRAMKLRNIMYITNYILPVGSEIITKRTGETFIKISDEGHSFCNRNGTWILKKRFLWEKNYGSIPKKYNVIFLDNNKFNFELDNLALATSNEIWLLNKYGLYFNDKEMTKAGIAIIKHRLATIKAMTKGMSEEERKKALQDFYWHQYMNRRKLQNAI
jgi:hypothetical protein